MARMSYTKPKKDCAYVNDRAYVECPFCHETVTVDHICDHVAAISYNQKVFYFLTFAI